MASDGVPVTLPVTRVGHGSQALPTVNAPRATGKELPAIGQSVPPAATPSSASIPPSVSKSVATAVPATAKASSAAADKAGESAAPARKDADLKALLAHLNKSLNDSGQPNQFRVAVSSAGNVIQEVNPSTGEVVGQYSTAEFPALARGLDVSGLVIDSHA